MKVSFILVLTVVFSGLLCCVPSNEAVSVASSNSETHLSLEDPDVDPADEFISKLWNGTLTLQSGLSSIIKIVTTKFCTIPESENESVTCFGQKLLPINHPLLRSILAFLNSMIDLFMEANNVNTDSAAIGRRRRMAENDTSEAVNSLVQLLTSPEGFTSQNLMTIMTDLIKWIWQLLSTQGLPQLRVTLDEARNSNDITPKGQKLIDIFNIGYSLLQRFDLIGDQ